MVGGLYIYINDIYIYIILVFQTLRVFGSLKLLIIKFY